MDTDDRGFPRGDLRVSDADRDRALAELSAAVQAGRITAGELDHPSGQALSARTGTELSAVLAALPVEPGPAPGLAARAPAPDPSCPPCAPPCPSSTAPLLKSPRGRRPHGRPPGSPSALPSPPPASAPSPSRTPCAPSRPSSSAS